MSVFRKILVALLVAWCPAVWAVWDARIDVVGANPPQPGATVSFEMADGTAVDGEVREDDDGGVFLFFRLPTDGPVPGTVIVDGQRYPVPLAASGAPLVVDLGPGALSGSGVAQSPRWKFGLSFGYTALMSDHLVNAVDKSAVQLADEVLAGAGATNISARGSADDDDSAPSIGLYIARQGEGRLGWYARAAVAEYDGFRGLVEGSGDAFGNTLGGGSVAESEVRIVEATTGITYALTDSGRWELFGGIGSARFTLDDDFVSSLLVNGSVVNEFSGSSDKKESAFVAEAGIRVNEFVNEHLSFSVSARTYKDALDDEITQIALEALLTY